jgi:hypothetical protein
MFVYCSREKWVFSPSCGVFFPSPLLQVFPFLIAWWCCCSCRPEYLFTAHVGGGSSPLSCRVFLPLPLSQAFPLLVAGCAHWFPPSPVRPGLFIYSSGKDSPPPFFSAQCAPPSLQYVFIVLIAYYSFSLFSPGGGQSVQEAMLFWPRVVCVRTAYCLAHLVHIFLGAGVCRPGGPPGFSV